MNWKTECHGGLDPPSPEKAANVMAGLTRHPLKEQQMSWRA